MTKFGSFINERLTLSAGKDDPLARLQLQLVVHSQGAATIVEVAATGEVAGGLMA